MILSSLRSRLLLSHFIVIVVALLVVAIAVLTFFSRPQVRYLTTLQRMDAISRATRNQIERLRLAGGGAEALIELLEGVAEASNTRVLIANTGNNDVEVVYDSDPSESWLGLSMAEATELDRNLLPSTDANTIAARYEHSGGSNWLLYSRALSNQGFGRLVVILAAPEPSPFGLFREIGLGRTLVQAGLIAVLLSVMLAVWIARSVARPLQKMANAAEAITEGDYDQQLPLEGPQEVRRVATSFNSMATQVAATRHAHRNFVANVSHDLKTPITAIQGWSQALVDGTAVTAEAQQHAASVIYTESERMARMVEQLLDLARIESGQMMLNRELVDLGQILTNVHHSLQLRAQEQGIHLSLDVQPVPPISGDHDRLMQLFTNLVDNALAHTPGNGRIHLSLRRHGEKVVEAIVQDTGKGIPPEELSRIFERFYQVEKSRARANGRRGSGLGLAIVHELVALHNGRIQARSEVGKGSAFIVRLPISEVTEPSTIIRRES